MSEQQYNVDLLMQVREKIVNEPEKHKQTDWAMAQSDPREGGDCGTTYCVAGWTAVLDGKQLLWKDFRSLGWSALYLADGETPIGAHAMEALGLSWNERERLFYGFNSRTYVLAALDKLIEAGKNGTRVPDGTL